jgi:hypothetical protein
MTSSKYGFRELVLDTLEELKLEPTPSRIDALFRLLKDALNVVDSKMLARNRKEKR